MSRVFNFLKALFAIGLLCCGFVWSTSYFIDEGWFYDSGLRIIAILTILGHGKCFETLLLRLVNTLIDW